MMKKKSNKNLLKKMIKAVKKKLKIQILIVEEIKINIKNKKMMNKKKKKNKIIKMKMNYKEISVWIEKIIKKIIINNRNS